MSYLYISHMVIHFIYKKRRRTYITTPLLYPLWYSTPFFQKMQAQKKQYHLAQSQLTPLDHILQQLQALLEFYANTGRQQFDEQDEAQWQELLHKLDAMGMTTFSNSLKQPQQDFSEQLVKTRYLLWVLQQLQVQLPRLELSQNDSVYTE